MNVLTHVRLAATALALATGPGCGLIGPSCLERQQRGTVTSLQGEVAAGQVVSHLVPYEISGSQNDASLRWDSRSSPNPARVRAYATRSACADFQPPPAANSEACAVLAAAGWTEVGIASTLIVTHGRGNPERLGSPPEYRIWVVGDAERSASYTITITWFYGPDC